MLPSLSLRRGLSGCLLPVGSPFTAPSRVESSRGHAGLCGSRLHGLAVMVAHDRLGGQAFSTAGHMRGGARVQ